MPSGLLGDLEAAERRIRGAGYDHVMVRGYMRLATSFAVGAQLSTTRQFHVACMQLGQLWSSEIQAAEATVGVSPRDLGQGDDLAVALSVTHSIAEDVLAYIGEAGLPIRRCVDIATVPSPGREAIAGAAHAKGWAMAAHAAVRRHARETKARKVHLFMAVPGGLAMLLGHYWNVLPTTQLYEDMNPGYAPAFLLPA